MRAPIFMTPFYKEMLWGGDALNRLYGKESPFALTGESWEAAAHINGSSKALGGELTGLTVGEIIERHGRNFLGSAPPADNNFPVLFKLIDARDRLSLQVHPDDALAAKDNDNGKTEMWLVLEAEENAGLYLGFEHPVTTEEYRRHIAENTLDKALHFVSAKPGDAFFLPHGMVHAIGAGLVIAEIQQSSDATYRVYDWGRVGLDGKLRPLHIEKAVAASNLEMKGDAAEPVRISSPGGVREYLPGCRFFAAQGLLASGELVENTHGRSFHILFCYDGEARIVTEESDDRISKGQTAIIPASAGEYRINGNARLYRFWVPDYERDYAEPLRAAGREDDAKRLFGEV